MQAPEQLLDQVRALDQIAHEHEQRDRDQHVVRHHRVRALHEEVEHLLRPRGRGFDAAIGEPGEDHAHAHQRERRGEAEHDRDDDQREHQQAEVAVGHLRRRRHQREHQDHDDRHDRKPEPDFLPHLRASPRASLRLDDTSVSSFAMSSSLTWTISFSLSTSTSSTSSSRDGQSPCLQADDAADDLDDALQQEERAGDRDDRLERIDRRPVGRDVRMLVDRPRLAGVAVAGPDERDDAGNEEQDVQREVERRPAAAAGRSRRARRRARGRSSPACRRRPS